MFCLRSREGDDKLTSFNVLKYVAIQELAHLMTKEVGHPPQFWENFKRLLKVAIKHNMYTKIDYNEKPVKYCGITIKSFVV